MKAAALLAALAALMACQPGDQPSAAAPGNASASAETPTASGSWRIVEVNGRPAQSSGKGMQPRLSLGPPKYGGHSGCTDFGGTALLHEGRLYAGLPESDAVGCGPLDAQQSAIFKLLASAPRIAFTGPDRLSLTAGESSLTLERIGPMRSSLPDEKPQMQLAGTGWQLSGANGEIITAASSSSPVLQFEAEHWIFSAPCGRWSGPWQQKGAAVELRAGDLPPSCKSNAFVSTLQRMLGSQLAYAAGPGDEVVIAGNGNFLIGRFLRFTDQAGPSLLTGKWLVRAIDGRPPNRSTVPPNVIFNKVSYGVWDGCNHTEGVYLTYGRQLFIHDSGLSTLANCLREQVSPQVPAIVGSRPMVARTAEGLALVSAAGRLDLQRVHWRSFRDPARAGLRAGLRLDLLAPSGPARVDLTDPRRFRIVLPCGMLQGDWRPGQPARFALRPRGQHASRCAAGPRSLMERLYIMFQGEVQAAVDGNNQRVLLLNRDQVLSGRVVTE